MSLAVSNPRRPAAPTAVRMLLALLVALGAAALPAASESAQAASTYSMDLASSRDFVAQKNFVQCVGASMQMMANMIAPRDDRTAATQLRLQNLARALSGPNRAGRVRQGASVRGWTAGLNQLGLGPYELVGEDSLQAALKRAARAIRVNGRPVGLLVWSGRHAWVMSGFTATADPLETDAFTVTSAYILDPLYPFGSRTWGASPRPGKALSAAAVGRQFVARGTGPTSNRWLTQTLAGKWVLVMPVPQVIHPAALRFD